MEVFSRMMQRVEAAGFIDGFAAGNARTPLRISHLLFADDSIIFCGADVLQLGHLRCTLLGFEAVSGLKINLQKTELMAVGSVDNLEELASILDCKVSSLPTTYLGLPLGAPYKSKHLWDPVLEKFRKRLAGWKHNYLSSGARITLIKSVLANLPTYFLSLFTAPASVTSELERLQRDFLWGRSEEAHKHSLVNWTAVCQPVEAGGVGFRQLKLNNRALLGKWLWRYMQEDSSLWKKLIVYKYGADFGGWSSMSVTSSYGTSLWKGIRSLWHPFNCCISWQVGRGNRIKFWEHDWLGMGCLSRLFPDIFALATDRKATIADYCSGEGLNGSWFV